MAHTGDVINRGIDLKQFKKYLKDGYGKPCKTNHYDCICCKVWRVYDGLKWFTEHQDELDLM